MKKLITQYSELKNSNAFSLIELIITLAIIVVIASVGFLSLANYSSRRNIALSTEEVIAVIRDTQNRSITQQDGKKWGIRFTNSTSNSHNYEVFSGANYASGTVSKFYSFRRRVTFTDPNDDVNQDILFSQITGVPDTSGIVITLTDGTYYGEILMRSNGAIGHFISSNLFAHWKLDEGTGTSTVDSSNNSYSATLTNSPTWQTSSSCKQGACLDFDGDDDYVLLSSSLTTLADFTLTGWVKMNSNASSETNGNNPFWKRDSQNRIYMRPSGYYLELNDFVKQGSTASNIDVWVHIAIVRNGTTATYYRNATLVTSWDIGSNKINFAGSILGTLGQFFNGLMDDVRLYEVALSATEVSDLYDFSK